MGLLADTLRPRNQSTPLTVVNPSPPFGGLNPAAGSYQVYGRQAYQGNEVIFGAIELRAKSAAEPRVVGQRTLKQRQQKQLRNYLIANGATPLQAEYHVTKNATETITEHPAIELIDRPNPFMRRYRFWSTIMMHLDLAGNAYAWIMRDARDNPVELWLLRPDRMKVIPAPGKFIDGYEYRINQNVTRLETRDVIHWKTRDPFDDYYGMPPLMPIMARVNIDNYMRDFVGAFFRNFGQPGAVLSVKQKLSQDAKDEIRAKHRSTFAGSNSFELMVLDQADASYTPTTMNLGQRGLAAPEMNAISESRMGIPFGIPLSILGGLTGQESSSYANKRQDWQVYWDLTLGPIYVDNADTLTLDLGPSYPDITEFKFDLSGVKALQEDTDALHTRYRADFASGGITHERFMFLIGEDPKPSSGIVFVPRGVVPTDVTLLGVAEADTIGDPNATPGVPAAPAKPAPKQLAAAIIDEVHCPTCNRWAGRNMNVGATAYCPKCKAFEVRDLTSADDED